MTTEEENQKDIEKQNPDQFLLWLNFNYALKCRECLSLVLDPDKVKGQLYLKGKCPSCGQMSVEPQTRQNKREKRAMKRERKRQQKVARLLARAGQ